MPWVRRPFKDDAEQESDRAWAALAATCRICNAKAMYAVGATGFCRKHRQDAQRLMASVSRYWNGPAARFEHALARRDAVRSKRDDHTLRQEGWRQNRKPKH